MKLSVPLLTVVMLAAARADAAPDCGSVLQRAREQQVAVADWQAGRRVAGKERLHFHSAPEPGCRLRATFVIKGDSLHALNEYGTFTEVQYVNPRTGRISLGWVESGRLEETIAAR
ncbi:hypothetical protein GTP41_16510 [Pseudoduganella sp. DS3]|uniref:Uncharacterized protein n=1 Tax=Pseudoduganella guangdongensis TaxID=2692179 RepID=A0A6N9HK41_9BURK|nr:hypothetical protein [Pseudoduganella guangdongensis]MYN03696.1 hypothetical protein [Pseudoduganella guangdongensis]